MGPASVYLGNLPPGISKDDIFSHLSTYGTISAIDLLQGYGFVEFASESDAMDVVNIYSNQPLLGTWVKVQLARNRRRRTGGENKFYRSPSPRRERSTSSQYTRSSPEQPRMRFPVTVHNLSRATCWQELKDFGRLAGGVVAYCDIDKKNRGRGFIEYLSREDAERAVHELSGKDLNGNVVTLNAIGTQRGRSRSRSPVGPRDRDIARHPHPYHNPRYSSDSHTDGRRSQRGSEYESRYYDREYMPPPPEGHYTTPPSQSYNYPSRDTWGTAYPPYGDGPSHSHMDPGRNPDPQPVNPHQSFGSMQPQEPSFDDYYRKILDAVKNAQLTQTHAATTHSQHR